jgi:transcriptional regulator with XRE-family HTH domain
MIGDTSGVERLTLIEEARRAAGMSQAELAWRARTTQSAISEYERRRKSPALSVAERLVGATGAELMLVPLVTFDRIDDAGVPAFFAPNRLWPLLPPLCFDRVRMPDLRRLSDQEVWDLGDRADRIQVYEQVMCLGTADMILSCVDGALLVDAWPDLDLPAPVREAWAPLVRGARRTAAVRDAGVFPEH